MTTVTAFCFALSYCNPLYSSAPTQVLTDAYEDMVCILVPPHSSELKYKLVSSAQTTHSDTFLIVLLGVSTPGISSYTPLSS